MFEQLNDWVSAQLAGGSGSHAWALLFAGGVLASLLPCVYPLYPVTVTILRGRTSRLGRAAHPLAYYLGLAGVYMALGVAAAFAGGTFNEIIRTPGFNLLVGGMFVALGASVVGLVEFPVLSSPQTSVGDDHRLAATVAMGAGAGFVSSACVGPVVVSVLVGLVVRSEALTASIVAQAGGQMFVFGLGVGLPVVLIGVFGLGLPKAGRWMVAIQWVFGVLIAYFAVGYLTNGLSGLGLTESAAEATLLGALLVLGATYLLQNPGQPRHLRGRNALVVLAGVCGFFAMARALLPGLEPKSTPGAVAQAAPASSETKHGLTWYLDRQLAYKVAERTGKPVFIDFYGSWCTNCKAFDAKIETDTSLRQALGGAVLLKVYDTAPLFDEYRSDPRFPELSVGLPFFLVTDARGHVIYKTNDYTKSDEMKLFLEG